MNTKIACLLLRFTIIFVFLFPLFSEAVDTITDLESQLQKASSPGEQLKCLNALVEGCMEEAPVKALEYGNQALNLLLQYPDDKLKAKVLNGMCWASVLLEQYRKALDLGKEAEILTRQIDDKMELIMALGSIANIYIELSGFDKALEYALEVKTESEQLDYKMGIASALVSIARVRRSLNEYEKALENYEQAKKISEGLGNKLSVARILSNIATVYWDMQQYPDALKFYKQANTKMEELGNEMGVALLMHNIACVYSKTGKFDQALKYDNSSLKQFEKIGNKKKIAYALGSIGRDYANLKNYKKALDYFNRSLQLAGQLKLKDIERVLYEEYTHIYEAMGDYKLALLYHKKFKETSDEILNEDRNKQIAQLQVVYDLEKREKENQLLKQNNHIQKLEIDRQKLLRNFLALVSVLVVIIALVTYNRYLIRKKAETVLRTSEKKLKKMNDAKDRLFTIIAHDLASPLNSLLLSSRHLQKYYHSLDEQDRNEFIQNIYRQTQDMSDLLENLLQWAIVQIGKIDRNPEQVDMRLLTTKTLEQIKYAAQKKNIRLAMHIMENTFVWADIHMMQAVIRNLLFNAIKYTHTGGEINISAKDAGSFVEITVSDNGVGISQEKKDRLFKEEIHESSRGTSNEKGTGLGLVLCKEFVEKNKGEIRVQSQPNQGSHFSFTLPKYN